MRYEVQLKPKAVKDLKRISREEASRILDALEELAEDLSGNVKKLTTSHLNIGSGLARIGFYLKLRTNITMVYRVLYRREAYRKK